MKKFAEVMHCDNSEENQTLEENFRKQYEEISIVFMSPGTPQAKLCERME